MAGIQILFQIVFFTLCTTYYSDFSGPGLVPDKGDGEKRICPGPKKFDWKVTLTDGKTYRGRVTRKGFKKGFHFWPSRGQGLYLKLCRVRRVEKAPMIALFQRPKFKRQPCLEALARLYIRRLDAPRGADRQAAEEGLIRLGRPIRKILHKVIWAQSPEARLRARRALKEIDSLPWQ